MHAKIISVKCIQFCHLASDCICAKNVRNSGQVPSRIFIVADNDVTVTDYRWAECMCVYMRLFSWAVINDRSMQAHKSHGYRLWLIWTPRSTQIHSSPTYRGRQFHLSTSCRPSNMLGKKLSLRFGVIHRVTHNTFNVHQEIWNIVLLSNQGLVSKTTP